MNESLNTLAASKVIGVKKRTLDSWRQSEDGPKFTKKDGRISYKMSDLIEFKRGMKK